jgi:enediyne biosynthesis protein E7
LTGPGTHRVVLCDARTDRGGFERNGALSVLLEVARALRHRDPVPLCTKYVLENEGVARLPIPKLLKREVWIVSKPEYVHGILVSNAKDYGKGGTILNAVSEDLGRTGLFTNNDDQQWRDLRHLMNPPFQRGNVPRLMVLAETAWREQMNSWNLARPVRLHDEFMKLNLWLLMEQIFGQSATQDEVSRLARLAQPVFQDMFKRILLSLILPPVAKLYTRARARLDEAVVDIIAKADGGQDDLLGWLKATQRQGNGFVVTNEMLRDQVFTLLMAGFDSTATVASWAVIELAQQAERFQQLQAEADGQSGHELNLPTLRNFVGEALRAHPAFPLFFRDARHAHTLGGHSIGASATIVINLDAMQRSAVSIPFGEGKRKCPAEDLATNTIVLLLAMLLRRFRPWRTVGKHQAARYTMTRWPRARAAVWLDER